MADISKFKGYAFLVGVGDYNHPKIDNVPAVVYDTEQLGLFLEGNGYKNRTYLINNFNINPADDFLEQIDYFIKEIEEDGSKELTVFVYFTGHGHFQDGKYYFLTNQIDFINPDEVDIDTCIPDELLLKTLLKIPGKDLIIIFNTCFAGNLERNDNLNEPSIETDLNLTTIPSERFEGIADNIKNNLSPKSNKSWVIISSTSSEDEKSWIRPDSKNSVFGAYVLTALKSGMVNIFKFMNYITEGMKNKTFFDKQKNEKVKQSPKVIHVRNLGEINLATPSNELSVRQVKNDYCKYLKKSIEDNFNLYEAHGGSLIENRSFSELIVKENRFFGENIKLDYHNSNERNIKKLLTQKGRKILIHGDSGLGKTIFIKYLTIYLADLYIEGNSDLIPVFIPLEQVSKIDINKYNDIDKFVLYWISKLLDKSKIKLDSLSKKIFFDKINLSNDLILLIDGWDEFQATTSQIKPDSDNLFHPINLLLNSEVFLVCSGRTRLIENNIIRIPRINSNLNNYNIFRINKFDDSQAQQFIDNYLIYNKDIRDSNEIFTSLKMSFSKDNEYLVPLVLWGSINSKIIPKTKYDLYERLFEIEYAWLIEKKFLKSDIDILNLNPQEEIEISENIKNRYKLTIDYFIYSQFKEFFSQFLTILARNYILDSKVINSKDAIDKILELKKGLFPFFDEFKNIILYLLYETKFLFRYNDINSSYEFINSRFTYYFATKYYFENDHLNFEIEILRNLSKQQNLVDFWYEHLRSTEVEYNSKLKELLHKLNHDEEEQNSWFETAFLLSKSLKQHEEAIICYEKALEIDPNLTDAWNYKGNSLASLNRLEEAIICYEKAIEIDPNLTKAWSNKGGSLGSLNRFVEAITCFENAIKNDPKNEFSWYHWYAKGRCLASLNRHEEAITCFEKALEINPNYTHAWNFKGISLASLILHEEAITCYEKALEIDPNDILAWNDKGFSLASLNRHEEAITCFEKALEINPNYTHAWNFKGISLASLILHEEAITCYEKALEIDPNSKDAWINKGISLGSLNRHEEAIICYEKALKINPNDILAWNNKGFSLASLNRHEEAIICYEKALKIDPNDRIAWNNKGISLASLILHGEAIICYQKALEIDPNFKDAWNNKGNSFIVLILYEDANICFEKALEIDPNDRIAWNNKGFSLASLNQHEEAIICYQKALEIDQNLVKAWNNKGNSLASLNQHEEAIICYQKALEIDPNYKDAWYPWYP